MEGRPALCNLTLTLRQQHGTASPQTLLDEPIQMLRFDWLSAASLQAARLPGCSCQTQATVWIATDVISRRPASPRASIILLENKKSCKCFVSRRVFLILECI